MALRAFALGFSGPGIQTLPDIGKEAATANLVAAKAAGQQGDQLRETGRGLMAAGSGLLDYAARVKAQQRHNQLTTKLIDLEVESAKVEEEVRGGLTNETADQAAPMYLEKIKAKRDEMLGGLMDDEAREAFSAKSAAVMGHGEVRMGSAGRDFLHKSTRQAAESRVNSLAAKAARAGDERLFAEVAGESELYFNDLAANGVLAAHEIEEMRSKAGNILAKSFISGGLQSGDPRQEVAAIRALESRAYDRFLGADVGGLKATANRVAKHRATEGQARRNEQVLQALDDKLRSFGEDETGALAWIETLPAKHRPVATKLYDAQQGMERRKQAVQAENVDKLRGTQEFKDLPISAQLQAIDGIKGISDKVKRAAKREIVQGPLKQEEDATVKADLEAQIMQGRFATGDRAKDSVAWRETLDRHGSLLSLDTRNDLTALNAKVADAPEKVFPGIKDMADRFAKTAMAEKLVRGTGGESKEHAEGRYRLALQDALTQASRLKGAPLNEDEAEKVHLGLTKKVVVGQGIFTDQTAPAFTVSLSFEERKAIEADLRGQGITPTEDAVRQVAARRRSLAK